MSCYKPRTAPRIGGVFIAGDGSSRLIPDQLLHDAKLVNGSELLRLCYSSCAVEISGNRLEKIFDDAAVGKLGTVKAHIPADDEKAVNSTSDPFIKSILHVPMSPVAASNLETSDEA